MSKTPLVTAVVCTMSLLVSFGATPGTEPRAQGKSVERAAEDLPPSYKVAFLGNSITQHAPWPSIGWDGNHGMAASTRDTDYVHQALARLQIAERDAFIRNLYPLERDASNLDEVMQSLAPGLRAEVVVIQLGDNTDPAVPGHLAALDRTMTRLVAAVGPGQKLLCTTTFWRQPSVDAIVSRNCVAAGGTVVGIGDIFDEQEQHPSRTYADYSVNRHPKDWAMAKIAERLVREIL